MTDQTRFLFEWRTVIRESDLPPNRRLIAHTLSDYMDLAGVAYAVSVERLGRESGMTPRRVTAHISALIEAGYLAPLTNRVGGRSMSVRYRAVTPPTFRTPTATPTPTMTAPSPFTDETLTPASPFVKVKDDSSDTKPRQQRAETLTPASPVLLSTLNNSPSKSRDIDKLVDAFAQAWVIHAGQTSTVHNPSAMKKWVITKWGAWARERFAAADYRPGELVDKARILGEPPVKVAL